jgi:hypothetical protein
LAVLLLLLMLLLHQLLQLWLPLSFDNCANAHQHAAHVTRRRMKTCSLR